MVVMVTSITIIIIIATHMIIVTVGIGIPTYDSMHSFILKNITKDNNNKDIGANNDHKW